jgi:hypothetical protein
MKNIEKKTKKKLLRGFWAVFITLCILYIPYTTALWVVHDFNPDFREIDSCLDGGGRWNYESAECELNRLG